MDQTNRADTRLRYRFANLSQMRAHVRELGGGRAVFFYRDEKLRPLPGAPVCLDLCFDDGEQNRLLHGIVAAVEAKGTWIELTDTRPARELAPSEYAREARRLGCDLLVELRAPGYVASGRMLDLSAGGARVGGVPGFGLHEQVEVRLLSNDRLTFHDLSDAYVAWTERGEVGLRFDKADPISRTAVSRLLKQTEGVWEQAFQAAHPPGCCGPAGLLEPLPPAFGPTAASG